MLELELKLRARPAQRAALLKALGPRRLEQVALSARYFDTADLLLARHGMGLRVRHEGERRVQTLKAAAHGVLERQEHELTLPVAATELDPQRHAGTPAGQRLLALLERHDDPPLQEVWRTDVTRTRRQLRVHGADVEWALDEGLVEAGGRTRPICELELEFKGGDPAGLFAAAHDWQSRHGLWLDIVSKAERGLLLRHGQAFPAPVKAKVPAWKRADADAAGWAGVLRAMVACCLQQILPNASALADDSSAPEHVHQLRVGLRRLRSVVREMAPFAHALPVQWEYDVRPVFEALGRSRDRHVLTTALLPELRQAGAPGFEPDDAPDDLGALVRGPAFQGALIGLLAFAQAPAQADALGPAGAGTRHVRKALQRLWRDLLRDAPDFADLPFERQHRLRKRLKRLRYLAAFAAPWFDRRAVKQWLERVEPAQDALGVHLDHCQAAARLAQLAERQPSAWFGAGWLRAQAVHSAEAGARALRKLAKAEPFWD